MTTILIHLMICVLYMISAFFIFLYVLNRWLILMPDGFHKPTIIFVVFVLEISGATTAGYLLPVWPWILCPLVILAAALLGELRRAVFHRNFRASQPVDTTPHLINPGNPITTTDLVCHTYQLSLSNWKGPAFRIAHISDLHVNRWIGRAYYDDVFARVRAQQPDLIFLTGDFVSKRKYIPMLKEIMPSVQNTPMYAVLGNHDYWSDPVLIKEVLTDKGIQVLQDQTVETTLHDHTICLTGFDHPWGPNDNPPVSTAHHQLHLALSHTPDNIYPLSKTDIDAVFSGHYHAGQFRLPLIGSIIIPSKFGRRFEHGHYIINHTHLFIPSGIGASNPPIRIYCQPDLFMINVT